MLQLKALWIALAERFSALCSAIFLVTLGFFILIAVALRDCYTALIHGRSILKDLNTFVLCDHYAMVR